MKTEDDLRHHLHGLAHEAAVPDRPWSKQALENAQSSRRRRMFAAGSLTLMVAAGGFTAVVLGNSPAGSHNKLSVLSASTAPSVQGERRTAGSTRPDIVHGVSVGGLPESWYPAGGVAPVSSQLFGGTRARHDLLCLPATSCEGIMILVFDDADISPSDMAKTETYGGVTGVLTADSTPEQGIALFVGQSRAAGYKRISATKYLIVRAPASKIPAILEHSFGTAG